MLLTSTFAKRDTYSGRADMFCKGTRVALCWEISYTRCTETRKEDEKDLPQTRRNVGVRRLHRVVTCTDNVREAGASRLICTLETSPPSMPFFPLLVISFPFDAIIRPTFTHGSTLWVNPMFQGIAWRRRARNIICRSLSEKKRRKV